MDATLVPDLGATAQGEAKHTKPLAWRQSAEGFAQWLEGKSLEELEVVEAGGRELYRETLRKVVKGNALEVPVLFRVPNIAEKAKSKGDALRLARKWLGIGNDAPPLTIASTVALIGETYYSHIENLCLLSYAIRDPDFEESKKDYPRHMLPDYLDAHYPTPTLYDALERLDWYAIREDPRLTEWSEDRFVEIIRAIDKRRNLTPLAAIAGRSRESFVLSMASRLASYLTPKS